MVKLYNDFQSKGLAVIGVSLDTNPAAWKKAIKDDKLPWLHLIANNGWKSEVVSQYFIDAVPTIYVLDANNKILAKNLRSEELRKFVDQYLNQLK